MRSFFSDLGLFNYILLVMILFICIVGVDIVTYTNINPTIEDIQEQYIKDLDRAVEVKREELKRKGLLIYRGGDNQ